MSETARKSHVQYTLDIDQYLVLSTILSVFLWQVLFRGAFNFYVGYVVVLANALLLFLRGELVIPRAQIYFLAGLTLVSALATTLAHNPIHAMISQIVGISFFSIYYYSVFHRTKFTLAQIIDIYMGWAVFVALWGYPLWLIHKLRGETLYRFHSWFAEPSHYVYATLPAVSYCLLKMQRDKRLDYITLPLLFSYVLADSSTGYLAIGITIILMGDFRSLRKIVVATGLAAAAMFLIYYYSGNLQVRVNDTLNAEIKSEATSSISVRDEAENPQFGENATTFALVTNGYVAWKAFLDSPIIGNGLGSHTISYEKYAGDIVSPKFILWGLNRDDANSLILRLASETGLMGLLTIAFLMFFFGRVKGSWHVLVRNAILPYFALRLVRFGAYFSLENFFFIMIYGFNYLQSRQTASINGDRSND